MEDGTVSIFGLVFGVAAAAPDSRVVLLASGTGAISAAVSMMAGTFLDVESTNDQAAATAAELRSRYEADPAKEDQAVHSRLVSLGFDESEATTVTSPSGHVVPLDRFCGYTSIGRAYWSGDRIPRALV